MSREIVVSSEQLSSVWPSVVIRPRLVGNCAGVDRSVDAYNARLDNLPEGVPLYSVGEPAHNNKINDGFKKMGVIFVDHASEVPDGEDAMFGPHGTPEEDLQLATAKGLKFEDTICPLVIKPHKEIKRYTEEGITTIYHGKIDKKTGAYHQETVAALAAGGNSIVLVTTIEEALSEELIDRIPDSEKVAFVSQTTHNADEETIIGKGLQRIFPKIILPRTGDVCYATRNRQLALNKMIIDEGARKIVVLGSKHSSNANNLVRVSMEGGAEVFFVDTADQLNPVDFYGSDSPVGITAAASTQMEDVYAAERFFTERGSEGPMVFDMFDKSGELITEEFITFKPPVIQGVA